MAYLKYMTPGLFAHLDAWNIEAILYYCPFCYFIFSETSLTNIALIVIEVGGRRSICSSCQKEGHKPILLSIFHPLAADRIIRCYLKISLAIPARNGPHLSKLEVNLIS